MASIDINKLIQESMVTTMGEKETIVQEGENPTVPETSTNDDTSMDELHEGMVSKVKSALGVASPKDKVSNVVDAAKGKAADAAEAVKKGAGAVKDAVADNPKVAGGAAGAAGLVGAGMLAKKYLKRKKK